MKTKPTLKDICREASVSAATVSRVINKSPLVNNETRQRVQDVIDRLGYTPNAAARNLSRNRTDLIGLVFHQISSGFYASVMAGIDEEARDKGYHILTAFSRDTADERDLCFTMFEATRVDGLIVLDSGLHDQTIDRLKSYRRPFVLIQKESDDDTVNIVTCNNEGGAYDAMKHLIDLGHKDILVLTGPDGAQDAQLRLRGCKRALEEGNVSLESYRFVCANYSPDRAPDVFRKYKKEHGLPKAVFALNDAMALAVIKELRNSNVSVPDQVAVVGFDGIDCARYMGLTTVQTPISKMGKEAVRLLIEQMGDDNAKAQHIHLEGELVIRETCGAPAASRTRD